MVAKELSLIEKVHLLKYSMFYSSIWFDVYVVMLKLIKIFKKSVKIFGIFTLIKSRIEFQNFQNFQNLIKISIFQNFHKKIIILK